MLHHPTIFICISHRFYGACRLCEELTNARVCGQVLSFRYLHRRGSSINEAVYSAK